MDSSACLCVWHSRDASSSDSSLPLVVVYLARSVRVTFALVELRARPNYYWRVVLLSYYYYYYYSCYYYYYYSIVMVGMVLVVMVMVGLLLLLLLLLLGATVTVGGR